MLALCKNLSGFYIQRNGVIYFNILNAIIEQPYTTHYLMHFEMQKLGQYIYLHSYVYMIGNKCAFATPLYGCTYSWELYFFCIECRPVSTSYIAYQILTFIISSYSYLHRKNNKYLLALENLYIKKNETRKCKLLVL